MTIFRRFIGTFFLSLVLSFSAEGYVGSTDLSRLVASSDLIVIAHVDKVATTNGVRIARAMVKGHLKGDKTYKGVYILASSTWTCDISSAKEGETAVFFLNKIKDRSKVRGSGSHNQWTLPDKGFEPLYRIAYVGRGRMPIHEKDGEKYVAVWVANVKLPASIKTFPKPEQKSKVVMDVKLTELIRAIRKRTAGPAGRPPKKL